MTVAGIEKVNPPCTPLSHLLPILPAIPKAELQPEIGVRGVAISVVSQYLQQH